VGAVSMGHSVAVDMGGTFTDFIMSTRDGDVRVEKIPSRHHELRRSFFEGLSSLGIEASEIDSIIHGSTIALNTILQLNGANVGLLTTQGFRDTLEICRGSRREMYNPEFRSPAPLVPRRLRRDVVERLDAHGNVVVPLDLDQAKQEVQFLLGEGCEAIAIVFLHAYRNPDHELAVKEIVHGVSPDTPVSMSHLICPEWREYERTSTTVLNAYVTPRVDGYLAELEGSFRDSSYTGSFSIVQSTGGGISARRGQYIPIRTMESGPAGGVIATADLARRTGRVRAIASDVGGTSFDVALVLDGTPVEKSQTELDYRPVLVPTLDIISVGAGGGSIAWVDAGGGLRVGPASAQANPGPACFGRGGRDATVTDAFVTLGLINPEYFLGSRMKLDLAAARSAVERDVGSPLDLDVDAAADAVVRLATMNMVLAIRNITIERGYDPREFSLFAFGGGGGMFAALIARELDISDVVVPMFPANFSAWGILQCDYRWDASRHVLGLVDADLLAVAFESGRELESSGREAVVEWGHPRDGEILSEWGFDLRYAGQEHTIRVNVPTDAPADPRWLRRTFEARHEFHYSHTFPDQPLELVQVRVVVKGVRPKPASPGVERSCDAERARKDDRAVRFPGDQVVECPTYDRERLGVGARVAGPAIIEEWTSTTVVPGGGVAEVDDHGNLVITLGA
jgi:N-methylhydantoinase A